MTRTDKQSVDYLLSFQGETFRNLLQTVPYAAIRFLRLALRQVQGTNDLRRIWLRQRINQLEREWKQRDHSKDATFNFINSSNRD